MAADKRPDEQPKITTGPNDRPRNDTIAETGAGLPDDSARPDLENDEEARRMAEKLLTTPKRR